MRKEVAEIIRALEIDDSFAEDLRRKTLENCVSELNAKALLRELEHNQKQDKNGNNAALYAIFESCAQDVLKDKNAAFLAANKAVIGFRKCGNCFNEGLFKWYNGLLYKEYKEDHLAIPELIEAIKLLKRCAESFEAESNFEKKYQCEAYIKIIDETKTSLDKKQSSRTAPPSVASTMADVWNKVKAHLTFAVYDIGHASVVGKFVFDDGIISKVEIEQVIINNKPFLIYNCRDGSEIKITSNGDYRWIKVAGESMNQAKHVPINPGDYVLVDVNLAVEYGQIVFASLNDPPTPEECAGIIKRYSRSGFRSESAIPLDSIPLSNAVIRGVVIAIAKEESQASGS